MKRPNFFIVGAAKAGTTSLVTYLREHPQVFISQPKEPHFFASDFPRYQAIDDEQRYLALFAAVRGEHRAVGEASTSSMYSRCAMGRIQQFQPDAKIIALLRNPVDMVHAAHAQFLHLRDETEVDFNRAWSLCHTRKAGNHVPTSCRAPELLYYDELAKFGEQLSRVYEHFPADQVRVILFEDLCQRTSDVYRDTLEFLDLRDDRRAEFPRVNANRRHRSLWLGHLSTRPPAFLMSLNEAAKLLIGTSEMGLLKRIRRWNDVVEPRRSMGPSVRRDIVATYRDDVDHLSRLLQIDLSRRWLGEEHG
jgi:hypothetical protein